MVIVPDCTPSNVGNLSSSMLSVGVLKSPVLLAALSKFCRLNEPAPESKVTAEPVVESVT